ncbi:hypothetical protein L1987_59241 [Smallanthus sonchifolius]|uniref:Uncharacterized protein n=1 Tax=Smallanthus sonchifolius TaxID=185202 RepID=A0ACB9D5K2_9ASTR|nr:hypothetical protein L1987_59241 [Smallanthus sonchifolius]
MDKKSWLKGIYTFKRHKTINYGVDQNETMSVHDLTLEKQMNVLCMYGSSLKCLIRNSSLLLPSQSISFLCLNLSVLLPIQ